MRLSRVLSLGAGGAVLAGAAMVVGAAMLLRRRPRFDFRDRVVLITGGSRGLGLVLARRFAREGARIVLVARDPEELNRAAEELRSRGADVMTVSCDITDRSAVERAVGAVVERFGRIDVLVNNAGVIQVGPLEHMTVADFESAMNVHVFGPLYMALAVVPHMRREGGGRIVNITSIGGKIAVPHLLPYTTSKFAMVGLSDGLRAELRKDNILVTTVCPGLMRTGSPPNALFKGQHEKEYAWFAVGDALPGGSMPAERAARRIVNASRAGRPRAILGVPAKVGWFVYEMMPGMAARIAGLANRLLPAADPARGEETRSGWQSQGLAPAGLTALSDMATRRNNEVPNGAGPAARREAEDGEEPPPYMTE